METLTPYPDVKRLLEELLERVQAILHDQFVGMYLFGSLTSGDFDQESDVDVLTVTHGEISAARLAALEAMHAQIYAGESPWATQLEAAYVPQQALRRYDPTNALHPHVDRGSSKFFMKQHDESWIVQRYVLRQRGITLAGPPPHTLIDPISANDLQQAMVALLQVWATDIFGDPGQLKEQGGQSYVVLSICRMLYTLQNGTVLSKAAAARWAQENLDSRWQPLIGRAWAGRRNPGLEAAAEDVRGTLEFMRFALEQTGPR
jgi:predicted nucleotidyltransferase